MAKKSKNKTVPNKNLKILAGVLAFTLAAGLLALFVSASIKRVGIDSSLFEKEGDASEIDDTAASGGSFVEFGQSGGGTVEEQLQAIKDQGIVVIGDSLLHQNAYLTTQQELQNTGWSNIVLSAQGCRATGEPNACQGAQLSLNQILDQVVTDSYNDPTDPNRGIVTIGNLNSGIKNASTIVIALGTNDKNATGNTPSPAEVQAKIRNAVTKIRNLNSDIDIHWTLNCELRGARFSGPNHNAGLSGISAELDIEMINWRDSCRNEYFRTDEGANPIHYVPAGAAVYGKLLADGAQPTVSDL